MHSAQTVVPLPLRQRTLVDLGVHWYRSMVAVKDPDRTWLHLVTPVAALAQVGALSEAWNLLRDHEVRYVVCVDHFV